MSKPNPCLTCGVCCTLYRVSFYWGECETVNPGGVPAHLTEPMLPHRLVMKGTSQKENKRCVALSGVLGAAVGCSIHPNRPSVCREYKASWSEGKQEERCDEARMKYGMRPLTPDDWLDPNHDDDRPPEPFKPAA
ncbi:MAG: YkgJ family cysteine cluster protein [Sumerlaeia bacterium]